MLWTADVCSRAAFAQPGQVSSISLGRFFSVRVSETDPPRRPDTWLHSGRLTCSSRTGFRAVTTPLLWLAVCGSCIVFCCSAAGPPSFEPPFWPPPPGAPRPPRPSDRPPNGRPPRQGDSEDSDDDDDEDDDDDDDDKPKPPVSPPPTSDASTADCKYVASFYSN